MGVYSHYPDSVREALTLRGLLVLGRTAVELDAIGYTAAMAEEDGFKVSRGSNAYWYAYVGDPLDTDAFIFLKPEQPGGDDEQAVR